MKSKKDFDQQGKENINPEIDETNLEESENLPQSFIQKNSIAISVVFIIIIAVAGYLYYSSVQEQKKLAEANLMLSRILPEYEQNNFEKALQGDPSGTISGASIPGLKEIAEKYEGTQTGAVAALLAGNALILENNSDEAKKMFELALDSESKIIVSGANAGIGACYENKGEYAEAAKYYENAAVFSETPEIKEKFNYYAALAYEHNGDKDKAHDKYNKIIKENLNSEFTDLAKSAISRVGMIIE
jgi:tetratricopeptide (TPR) repeat protein